MDNNPNNYVSFVTTKKRHVMTVQQPILCTERFKQGAKEGKVKSRRLIQFNEDLDTIYLDEQRKMLDNPKPTHIFFTKKPLTIHQDERSRIEFLRKHPDNEANGGRYFKELDVVNDEILELKAYEELDKAKQSLMAADDNLVRAIAVWFLGSNYAYKRINKLKLTLRQKLDMNLQMQNSKKSFVEAFNEFVADKNNDEKLTLSTALDKNVIKISSGNKIAWSDTNEVIFTASRAGDVIKDFALWLKNDEEGRHLLKTLVEKLEAAS